MDNTAGGVRLPGRPPQTSARSIEVIALRLFASDGYGATTVEDIAATAGVSRRTFFRYFPSKADVLWGQFDEEITRMRALLEETSRSLPVMTAIRQAILAANTYHPEDIPELRTRMGLVTSEPELFATAAVHYDAWERAVAEFVARRTYTTPLSLRSLAIARSTLATCRAAYDVWMGQADGDLTGYLDEGLRALASGFNDES